MYVTYVRKEQLSWFKWNRRERIFDTDDLYEKVKWNESTKEPRNESPVKTSNVVWILSKGKFSFSDIGMYFLSCVIFVGIIELSIHTREI